MSRVHTHYENLMVSRNAPLEVIRASYLTLSKKFHPDVNHSPDASRIMKILNNAYDVLSDSEKRKLYDISIREAEAKTNEYEHTQQPRPEHHNTNSHDQGLTWSQFVSLRPLKKLQLISLYTLQFMVRNPRLAFFVIMFSVIGIFKSNKSSYDSSKYTPRTYEASQTPSAQETKYPEYERPISAPNGNPWPEYSGYISGYGQFNDSGRSTIKVENFQNDDDFYVKLVDTSGNSPETVRHVMIKGKDEFEFKDVSPGTYQLMYMDIDTGSITKSQDFEVKEIRMKNGVKVSSMVITLFKVRNGNFKSERIDLNEFLGTDKITSNKLEKDFEGIRI